MKPRLHYTLRFTRLVMGFVACLFALAASAQGELLHGTVIGTAASVDYSTGSMSTTVNTRECAFDGNLSTYYASYSRSGTWVGLDLGTPHVITQVGWSPRNDSNGPKRVCLAVFEGSNQPDFLDAVPLYMVTENGVIGTLHTADVNVSRGFRYVRYVGPNDARCNVAEVQFYGYESEGEDGQWYQLTNLPLVSIHTQNAVEPTSKETEIPGIVSIISKDGTKLLTDTASTRLRGNASKDFPKKPYRIRFDEKHHVAGSPAKAKKWTLINNYGDKSLMRNMLAFQLSEMMGMPYTPFCTPVDVILNGEYKGCYQLCDQVQIHKDRVDIDELDPTATTGDALTGGYLFEIDAYAYNEPSNSYFYSSKGTPVTIKSPGEDDILTQQYNYIKTRFNNLESRLYAANYKTATASYRELLDLDTFLKHFLVGEMSGNTDTYWSVYMYKKFLNDTIFTGPVWDFDLAFNNDNRIYPVNSKTDWIYRSGGSYAGDMKNFVNRILGDANALSLLKHLWAQARQAGLSAYSLNELTDTYATLLDESQRLNFKRWNILNTRVHQNPQATGSYAKEVQIVKDYLTARVAWMDKKLGYDGTAVDDLMADRLSPTDDAWYTLQGLRLDRPTTPGIYIHQGKKVVIK